MTSQTDELYLNLWRHSLPPRKQRQSSAASSIAEEELKRRQIFQATVAGTYKIRYSAISRGSILFDE